LKLESSVIRQIHLFGRAIDEKDIRRRGEPSEPVRSADLKKVRCGDALAVRSLNDDSSVSSGNTAAIVGVQRDGESQSWRVGETGFWLPPARCLRAAGGGIDEIVDLKPELVKRQSSAELQAVAKQVD